MVTLDCVNLSKKYDGKTVVHDISISLQGNRVIGLLGPNGAGKTTTFYMLVGLIKSNSVPNCIKSANGKLLRHKSNH